MKSLITLQHGWGLNKTFWSNLIQQIDNSWLINNLDTNYFYNKNNINELNLNDFKLKIAIGHSLGFAKLLLDKKVYYDLYFGICPFSFFCKQKNSKYGWETKVVDLMIKKIQQSPIEQINAFYLNANLKDFSINNNHFIDKDKIINDLEMLKYIDIRYLVKQKKTKIFCLYSNNDQIIKKQHFIECFIEINNKQILQYNPAIGHSLGYNGSSWVWQEIKKVIANEKNKNK